MACARLSISRRLAVLLELLCRVGVRHAGFRSTLHSVGIWCQSREIFTCPVPSADTLKDGVEFLVRIRPSATVQVCHGHVVASQMAESHSVTLPRLESFLRKLVAVEKLVQY